MKSRLFSAILLIALIPGLTFAAPSNSVKHKTITAPTAYTCSVCQMIFTAAQAKKDHYKDPMDGGKLLPVKSTAKPVPMIPTAHDLTHPSDSGSMPGMKM
jgi:hypothetical protein